MRFYTQHMNQGRQGWARIQRPSTRSPGSTAAGSAACAASAANATTESCTGSSSVAGGGKIHPHRPTGVHAHVHVAPAHRDGAVMALQHCHHRPQQRLQPLRPLGPREALHIEANHGDHAAPLRPRVGLRLGHVAPQPQEAALPLDDGGAAAGSSQAERGQAVRRACGRRAKLRRRQRLRPAAPLGASSPVALRRDGAVARARAAVRGGARGPPGLQALRGAQGLPQAPVWRHVASALPPAARSVRRARLWRDGRHLEVRTMPGEPEARRHRSRPRRRAESSIRRQRDVDEGVADHRGVGQPLGVCESDRAGAAGPCWAAGLSLRKRRQHQRRRGRRRTRPRGLPWRERWRHGRPVHALACPQKKLQTA
mmetsp:Transcript_43664/g.117037  ORF Transcript_43664/g.117037 Transcript_43664/m.117037 type:complete len:369 (+) Transcript_43664:134-1240(+)